jgi:hypothetical protein
MIPRASPSRSASVAIGSMRVGVCQPVRNRGRTISDVLIGVLLLIGGIALVLWGAERFTDGAVGTSTCFGLSTFYVGALVSGAGSTPRLFHLWLRAATVIATAFRGIQPPSSCRLPQLRSGDSHAHHRGLRNRAHTEDDHRP